MSKAQRDSSAPRKQPVQRRLSGAHRVKRSSHSWFSAPEIQAGIAEAEADFANGRFYTTDSAEAAQKLLDSWK